MTVPPRLVRRTLLAPAVGLLTLLLISSIPLTALVAAFASPLLPGRLRPLRFLAFVIVYLVLESAMLVALTAVWVASAFGRRLQRPRWQAVHYRLMHLYLLTLVQTTERIFNLAIDIEDDPVAEADRPAGVESKPLIVLSRHAGPGDSFLLVHGMLARGRRPRIVLRDTLQWAPALDITLNRLPNVFVSGRRTRNSTAARIFTLASDLGPRDALTLFPEGRNFTASRRLHSIARLEELGRHQQAEHAREMRHVLTPRAGGTLAALRGAPTADVVFVGHTGLENLSSVVDLWRGLPMDSHVKVKVWRVDRSEVPENRREAVTWLLGWWRRIDAWIVDNHGPVDVPDAIVEAVADSPPDEPPTRGRRREADEHHP